MARPIASLWQALSEVPGWPDAPLRVRLRRMWPLVIPLVVCIVCGVWIWGVREPHRSQFRQQHAALIALDDELTQLQQAYSEQQAVELAEAATAAQQRLLEGPDAVQARLDAFVARARAAGWKATAQVYGVADADAETARAAMVRVPARLRLEPRQGNPDPFNSLMALLRLLTQADNRMEFTLVNIRADQPGMLAAEINLRAACRPLSP